MTGLEDYSGFEVIRAAMEVEKNGHRFYAAMALKAGSPLAREIFGWLAQDEIQHLKTLEGLVREYEKGAFWENEDQFLPYLRRFSESEIFPSPDRLEAVLMLQNSDLEAFDLAIEAEEKFAEYFSEAARKARSDEGKKAFAWLAGEEERHAMVLKDRRQKLQAGAEG